MKTILFLIALITVCFADDFITTENRMFSNLAYQKPLYTNTVENNDTTYTVIKKESEYFIIREYKIVDTVKVKVVK